MVHFFRLTTPSVQNGTATTLDHGAATAVPSPSSPSTGIKPAWSIDVNAMNFCRMSVMRLGDRKGKGKEREGQVDAMPEEALMAVPSLTKDDFVRLSLGLVAVHTLTRFAQVDIFHVPSKARLHRSVGKDAFPLGVKTGEQALR